MYEIFILSSPLGLPRLDSQKKRQRELWADVVGPETRPCEWYCSPTYVLFWFSLLTIGFLGCAVAEAKLGEQRRAPGAVLPEGRRQGHVPKLRAGVRQAGAWPLHDLRYQRLQAALQALSHTGKKFFYFAVLSLMIFTNIGWDFHSFNNSLSLLCRHILWELQCVLSISTPIQMYT